MWILNYRRLNISISRQPVWDSPRWQRRGADRHLAARFWTVHTCLGSICSASIRLRKKIHRELCSAKAQKQRKFQNRIIPCILTCCHPFPTHTDGMQIAEKTKECETRTEAKRVPCMSTDLLKHLWENTICRLKYMRAYGWMPPQSGTVFYSTYEYATALHQANKSEWSAVPPLPIQFEYKAFGSMNQNGNDSELFQLSGKHCGVLYARETGMFQAK